MERIGLIMHVGIDNKKSKTVVMLFRTKENIQNWIKITIKQLFKCVLVRLISAVQMENRPLG